MDSHINEQQYLGAELQLSEPHFEEEATLLSARPVVPLHEVKAEEPSGRRLTIGLALVAALFVGALVATVIYTQLGKTPATATVETATQAFSEAAPEAPATTAAGGATSNSPDSPTAASQAPEKESDGSARDRRNVAITRPKKSTPSVQPSSGSSEKTETVQAEDIDPAERKAERRAQRMEARRLRREAERQAWRETRGRRVQPTDDLLRIREIFEGSRRRP